MLAADFPFVSESRDELSQLIRYTEPEYSILKNRFRVSNDCISFIKKLLMKSPDNRISLYDAMNDA